MTHDELGRLLKNQTTPEFDAMPPNKKMTTDQKTTKIRDTVEHLAYELLHDCKPPSKVYDGHSYYLNEHWKISIPDLYNAVTEHLAEKGWEWEEGDIEDQDIEYFCWKFLKSYLYEDMIEEIRRGYYEAKYEDENPYKSRGLSRSDF